MKLSHKQSNGPALITSVGEEVDVAGIAAIFVALFIGPAQIIKIWRTHDVGAISHFSYYMWGAAAVLQFIHATRIQDLIFQLIQAFDFCIVVATLWLIWRYRGRGVISRR